MRISGWLWGLLVVVAASACRRDPLPLYPHRDVPLAQLADPAVQAQGDRLFARFCASCHGHPGEGRSARADFFVPPAPDFYEIRYRNIDPAYLYWRIDQGKMAEPFLSRGSVMPAWGPTLRESEIWALVAYLRIRG